MTGGAPRRLCSLSVLNDLRHRAMLFGKPIRRIIEIVYLSLGVRLGAAWYFSNCAIVLGWKILVRDRESPCQVHAIPLLWRFTCERRYEKQTKRRDPNDIPHARPHRRQACFG